MSQCYSGCTTLPLLVSIGRDLDQFQWFLTFKIQTIECLVENALKWHLDFALMTTWEQVFMQTLFKTLMSWAVSGITIHATEENYFGLLSMTLIEVGLRLLARKYSPIQDAQVIGLDLLYLMSLQVVLSLLFLLFLSTRLKIQKHPKAKVQWKNDHVIPIILVSLFLTNAKFVIVALMEV